MKQILIQKLRLQIQTSLNKTKMGLLATVVQLLTFKHQLHLRYPPGLLLEDMHMRLSHVTSLRKFEISLPAKVYQCPMSLEERQHKNQ